jgi:hypothetical protein
MRTFLWSFLSFFLGLIAGWSVAIGIYIAATTWFGLVDRDGGGAMGAIFILGPALGILLGLFAAVFTALRLSRSQQAAPTGPGT